MRLRVKADGTLTEGELFFDATSILAKEVPTGSKSISAGIVRLGTRRRVDFFSRGRKHIATILMTGTLSRT